MTIRIDQEVRPQSIKGGNLFIDAIRVRYQGSVVPFGTPIPAGEEFDVEVVVANGALQIQDDVDSCEEDTTPCPPPGLFQTQGYCAGVDILPDWASVSSEHACVQIALVGVGRHTFTQTLTAPSSSGEVTVRLYGTASGEQTSQSFPIPVSGGGNGGNGGNGDNGDNGDNGGASTIPTEYIIAGSAVAIGLGLVLASNRR